MKVNQQNGIKSAEMNSNTYSPLIFNNVPSTGERTVSSTNGAGTTG
jgi:hypothetical protein